MFKTKTFSRVQAVMLGTVSKQLLVCSKICVRKCQRGHSASWVLTRCWSESLWLHLPGLSYCGYVILVAAWCCCLHVQLLPSQEQHKHDHLGVVNNQACQ